MRCSTIIKHNKVLHERVILLTVKIADVPYVEPEQRFAIDDLGDGFFRVVLNYGFMEETDVPAALKADVALRREVQDDADQLLPFAPDADRRASIRAWRCGARSCSRG